MAQIVRLFGRIDTHSSKEIFTVIDYKTGSLPSFKSIKNGEALQMPLYVMAVEQLLLKKYAPAGGVFIGLKEFKKSGFVIKERGDEKQLFRTYQVSLEDWDIVQQKTKDTIIQVDQSIEQGLFDPKPQSPSLCRFCSYKDICSQPQDQTESSETN